jgi:hypothetical protein
MDIFFNKKNYIAGINLLAIILGLFASTTTIGFVLKSENIYKFGRTLGFSPLPLPFQDMGEGRETMNFKHVLYGKDFSNNWVELGDVFLNVFERPHRVGVPFEAMAAFVARIPSSQRKSMLQYECKFYNVKELKRIVFFQDAKSITVKVICKK